MNERARGFYVGSSRYCPARWSYHRSQLRRGVHANSRLQRTWAKYGEQAFRFEMIAVVPHEELHATEQRLLDKLASHPDCYNMSRHVNGFPEWTPEAREAVAARFRGKPRVHSEETKAKIRASALARLQDPAHRASLVDRLKPHMDGSGFRGRHLSPAAREQLRQHAIGRPNGMTGRKHTAESRALMSERRRLAHLHSKVAS